DLNIRECGSCCEVCYNGSVSQN
ncbi:unnamed protein product, partial [Allacma fusca]